MPSFSISISFPSLVVLAVLSVACPPAATLPPAPTGGCSKDTDCKGARICVKRACVEPPVAVVDGGAPDLLIADAGEPVVTPPVSMSTLGPSPMFHVDATHSGRSRYRAPASTPKEHLKTPTGGTVFGSPAIATGGIAVFGSHDHSVYAVGPDGSVRWKHATADLVWCSPALGPGVVYVGSDDDKLYALNLDDGEVRWTFTAGPCRQGAGPGPEGSRCDVDGVTVGSDGTIYASADGLYALKPDGTPKWKFSPGTAHCGSAPALNETSSTVYIGCQDDAIYAVDSNTGVKRWEFRTQGDVDSSPAVGADGTIYVGSDDHKLYALGPSGALRFAVATAGAIRSSPAVGPDGTVYVGSGDNGLYAIRPGGVVAWIWKAADRILSSPLVDAAGLVVFGSQDDRLYALGADGKLVWSVLLDGDVDGSPALGSDGTLYVGSDDRALHILRNPIP